MNLKKSTKYGLALEGIERKALSNERFKTVFNMIRIENTQGLHRRLDDYDKKKIFFKEKTIERRAFYR